MKKAKLKKYCCDWAIISVSLKWCRVLWRVWIAELFSFGFSQCSVRFKKITNLSMRFWRLWNATKIGGGQWRVTDLWQNHKATKALQSRPHKTPCEVSGLRLYCVCQFRLWIVRNLFIFSLQFKTYSFLVIERCLHFQVLYR